jgi:endo-1,4-beta-D-glucanase Y
LAARERHRQGWPYFLHNTPGVGLRAAVTGRRKASKINERQDFLRRGLRQSDRKYFTEVVSLFAEAQPQVRFRVMTVKGKSGAAYA